jgi:hypothetical protein
VLTPMSECRTSCTCCWVRGSCASFGSAWLKECGASAGADASLGDVGAAASLLGWPWWPLALGLVWKSESKSGLKLSVLSMGGSVGGMVAMLKCGNGKFVMLRNASQFSSEVRSGYEACEAAHGHGPPTAAACSSFMVAPIALSSLASLHRVSCGL